MKHTVGFSKDDGIFQSAEFNNFNEATIELPATKIFEYAYEIIKNCEKSQYSDAWYFAYLGVAEGLDAWEEAGAAGNFVDFLDDAIISKLYQFFMENSGGF